MIWIVLPAYNESLSIEPLFKRFAAAKKEINEPFKVVVVDDGSSDDTAERAERTASVYGLDLYLVRHKVNSGLGETIKTGLTTFINLSSDGDFCCTMDCDNTQPPELIKSMIGLARRDNLDIVVASRYQHGSDVKGLSLFRLALSQGASTLFQLCAPIPGLKDYTCGFRLYSREFLLKLSRAYGEQLFTEKGFSCMADILLKSKRLNPRVAEVAMVLRYDEKLGESKMKVFRTIYLTLQLLVKHLTSSGPSGHAVEKR
jgi:dolichol-phosphate mannosyltransferase